MTALNDAPKNLFGFADKIFNAHNGALLIMSAPPSIGIAELIDALLADTPLNVIIFPALVAIITIFCYGLMFTFDFLFGLYASYKSAGKGNEYFESSKGYSSIFKMFAVVSLIFMLSMLSIVFALAHWDWISKGCITFAAAIGLMGTLFDFASIGENQKKITGKQHPIFTWIRSITELIEEEFTLRIKSFFQNFKRTKTPQS